MEIFRFGNKDGFQSFPRLEMSLGQLGVPLTSESGLYFGPDVVKEHAKELSRHHATGVERCFVYALRSAQAQIELLALALPVEANKKEWRRDSFVGVALLARAGTLVAAEALGILKDEMNILMQCHPVSSGYEEGPGPLNWMPSSRLGISKVSLPWNIEMVFSDGVVLPAFHLGGTWDQRVQAALLNSRLEQRVLVLPYHEDVPRLTGWRRDHVIVGKSSEDSNQVIHVGNDIKRLEEALRLEREMKEEFAGQLKREASQHEKFKKRALVGAALGAVTLIFLILYPLLTPRGITEQNPALGSDEVYIPDDNVEWYAHAYWVSLVNRSMAEGQEQNWDSYPDPGPSFYSKVLGLKINLQQVTIGDLDSIGPYFFEERERKIIETLEALNGTNLNANSFCRPCLKYGILSFQVETTEVTQQKAINLKQALDNCGEEQHDFLEDLRSQAESGFLGERLSSACAETIVVLDKHKIWEQASIELLSQNKALDVMTPAAKEKMIEELTLHMNPQVNESSNSDTITVWIPHTIDL